MEKRTGLGHASKRLVVLLASVALLPAQHVASAAPEGDRIADAVVIHELPFSGIVNVAGATRDEDEPRPSCLQTEAGWPVWLRYTSSVDRHIVVGVRGQDSFLTVFRGSEHGSLEELRCVDAYFEPAVTVPAAAGETIYIGIGNWYPHLDPNLILSVEQAAEFDLSVTDLTVRSSFPAASIGSLTLAVDHVVTVDMANLSDVPTPEWSAFLDVKAVARGGSDCSNIATDYLRFSAGGSLSKTYTWRPVSAVGNITIIATLVVYDAHDLDTTNNRREASHVLVVGGLDRGEMVAPLNPC